VPARYHAAMVTTLDMLPETAPVISSHDRYAACWAASGTLAFVVVDDRLAANPINHVDPFGTHILSITDASPPQAAALKAAHDAVLKRLPAVISEFHKLGRDWVESLYPKFYAEADTPEAPYRDKERWRRLGEYVSFFNMENWILDKMFQKLGEGIKLEVECKDDGKGTYAYVHSPGGFSFGAIHFYPLYFKQDPQTQAQIFAHELSHRAIDTADDDLQWYNWRKKITPSTPVPEGFGERAANDASFISLLFGSDYSKTPPEFISVQEPVREYILSQIWGNP
jgi:hypothetical protein